MREYFNVYDEDNLKYIEKEYQELAINKKIKARNETQALAEGIDNYRELTFDEIVAKIEQDARKLFYGVDDETTLRKALFESVEREYLNNYDFSRLSSFKQKMKIDKHIDELISFSTDEDRKRIIDSYRKTNYEKYVNDEGKKAMEYKTMFQSMSEDELKDYITLHFDYRVCKNLLDARKEAIAKVCDKKNVDLPLCMVDEASTKAINREVRYVVRVNLQNEKQMSLKEKVLAKARDAMITINENANAAAIFTTFGFLAGGITCFSLFNSGYEPSVGIAAWAAVTPVVTAAISIAHRKITISDNKDSLKEAESLGLLKRKIDAEKHRRLFYDYHNNLKKKYTSLKIEGGNNGLHQ